MAEPNFQRNHRMPRLTAGSSEISLSRANDLDAGHWSGVASDWHKESHYLRLRRRMW